MGLKYFCLIVNFFNFFVWGPLFSLDLATPSGKCQRTHVIQNWFPVLNSTLSTIVVFFVTLLFRLKEMKRGKSRVHLKA